MSEYQEDSRNGLIAVSFIVGGLILAVIFVAGEQYFAKARYEAEFRNNLSVESPEVKALHLREEIDLTTYQWKNKDEGVLSIPIERAMALVVEESRNREN